ncbi:MAG: efflux RND transporter periplasmic adaptor subunit [Candidatus Shapirobacteria bacterium]|jgi:RND family efflux transporter MFP subunit
MNFFEKNILKIFIGIILATAVFVGFNQVQAQNSKDQTQKFNPKKDIVYTPKFENIKEELIITGSISADKIASLRFQNSGRLVWVGVKVGDRVKKWQALASLDRKELEKNLSTQFNNYLTTFSEFHDTEFDYKTTRENALVTDTVQRILDRTQYSLNNAVIKYEIADMALKESVLSTPIEGVVVGIDQPIPGTNITPATATFTVIDPGSIFFKSEIDQQDVTKITTGQLATIKIDAFPGQEIASEISYLSFIPVSGQTSTVYEVRFNLPLENNDLLYRLGMDGDATLVLSESANALTIPTDAVYDDNGQSYVYKKNDNLLVRQDIKIGIETDTTTEVKEGLTQNDQVVLTSK